LINKLVNSPKAFVSYLRTSVQCIYPICPIFSSNNPKKKHFRLVFSLLRPPSTTLIFIQAPTASLLACNPHSIVLLLLLPLQALLCKTKFSFQRRPNSLFITCKTFKKPSVAISNVNFFSELSLTFWIYLYHAVHPCITLQLFYKAHYDFSKAGNMIFCFIFICHYKIPYT
jgi:hypothetical protein